MIKPTSLFAALYAATALLSAQPPAHAPDGGTRQMITSIVVPPLPSAPFTATVNTEWTRTLEDGARMTLKNHRRIARDAQGRVFQERRFLAPERADNPITRLTSTEVADPTTRTAAFCSPYEHVCELHAYSTPAVPPVAAPGRSPGGGVTLARTELGTQTVNGLEIVGTREVTTVNGAVLGTDRPITITKEFWYSRQLGLNIVTRRDDPRNGAEVFTIDDISLGDPDPHLFALPADARIIDRRPSAPRR
jgi:hypothetical protein